MKLPYLETIFMKCLKRNCFIARSIVVELLYIYYRTYYMYSAIPVIIHIS